MIIHFHKNFNKDFEILSVKFQDKAIERMKLFSVDPTSITLNSHALQGKYKGFRSINISGDIRAIYKVIDECMVIFVAIGTHSNLYK